MPPTDDPANRKVALAIRVAAVVVLLLFAGAVALVWQAVKPARG